MAHHSMRSPTPCSTTLPAHHQQCASTFPSAPICHVVPVCPVSCCLQEPRVLQKRSKDVCGRDEEFGRQMLAGFNPSVIQALKQMPPTFTEDDVKGDYNSVLIYIILCIYHYIICMCSQNKVKKSNSVSTTRAAGHPVAPPQATPLIGIGWGKQ